MKFGSITDGYGNPISGGSGGIGMATFVQPPSSSTFAANPNNGSSTLSTLSNSSLLLNGPKAVTSEANNGALHGYCGSQQSKFSKLY